MITQADCIKMWGNPENTVKWQAGRMTLWYPKFHLTEYEAERYSGGCFPNKIFMNKKMVAPFTQAVKNLIASGNYGKIRTWDGCFFIRKMKRFVNGKITYSGNWSLHSWGIAFDIDANWNGLGVTPVIDQGIVDDIVRAGFDWGGTWKTKDGMHFQLSKI